MRTLKILCLFLVLSAAPAAAQVLNIESMRFLKDTDGWMGDVHFGFSAEDNVNTVYTFSNDVHVQYKKGHSRCIFINDLNLQKANDEDLVNTGYQHVRYGYRIGDTASRWTWEAFVQTQYNKPAKMDFRGVTGTGPRYQIIRNNRLHMYAASLFIYEHEIDQGGDYIFNDKRISSYIALTWLIAKNAEAVNTVYYQPNICRISDYRISEEFAANIGITHHFGISTVFGFLTDTKQPPGVPNFSWHFREELLYSF